MFSALLVIAAVTPRIGVIVDVDDQRTVVDELAHHYAVVPAGEMQKDVEAAASLGITCALDDAACLARVAAFAKASFLIAVSSTPDGVRALLVDAATSQGRGASSPVTAERAVTVRALVAALVAHVAPTGALSIVTEDGAVVTVDGVARGAAPLDIADLAPGGHTVAVRTEDGRSADATAVVCAGVVTPVTPALPPSPAHLHGAGAHAPHTTAPVATDSPLRLIGGVVAGTGIVVAGALLVAGGIVTPSPTSRIAYSAKEYNDATALGGGLYITSVVFGAVALVGAGIGIVGLAAD